MFSKYQLCAEVLDVVVPAFPAVESIPVITWMSDVVTGTLSPLVIQYSGLEWLNPDVVDGNLGTVSSVWVTRYWVSTFVM